MASCNSKLLVCRSYIELSGKQTRTAARVQAAWLLLGHWYPLAMTSSFAFWIIDLNRPFMAMSNDQRHPKAVPPIGPAVRCVGWVSLYKLWSYHTLLSPIEQVTKQLSYPVLPGPVQNHGKWLITRHFFVARTTAQVIKLHLSPP